MSKLGAHDEIVDVVTVYVAYQQNVLVSQPFSILPVSLMS